jgi:hypothetical protein
MINFRFHIVSLTAVFLAFAVGLVLGTTFLDDATARLLERQVDNLDADLRTARDNNADLQEQLDRLDQEGQALDEQLGTRILPGELAAVPVLVVAPQGVDQDLVDRVMTDLGYADADVRGVWWLTERLRLEDESEVEDLASALEVATDDVDRLRRNLSSELANALFLAMEAGEGEGGLDAGATDPALNGGPVGDPGQIDPGPDDEPLRVARLHERGFIDYQLPEGYQPPEGADEETVLLPVSGLRIVVVDGSGSEVPEGEVLAPTLNDLVSDGPAPVVVAAATPEASSAEEPPEELAPLVAEIRGQRELAERISTVDSLDMVSGPLATVLALAEVQPDSLRIGHYGFGPDVEAALPPLPEDE